MATQESCHNSQAGPWKLRFSFCQTLTRVGRTSFSYFKEILYFWHFVEDNANISSIFEKKTNLVERVKRFVPSFMVMKIGKDGVFTVLPSI